MNSLTSSTNRHDDQNTGSLCNKKQPLLEKEKLAQKIAQPLLQKEKPNDGTQPQKLGQPKGKPTSILNPFQAITLDKIGQTDHLSSEALRTAIFAATKWLVTNQHDDGSFNYMFLPSSGKWSDEDNSTRQSGRLWDMAKMGKAFNNKTFTDSTIRAFNHHVGLLQYANDRPFIPYKNHENTPPERREGNLGSTALFLLGLVNLLGIENLKLENSEDHLSLAINIGKSICSLQVTEGENKGRLYCSFTNKNYDFNAAQYFYPVEALLALSDLSELLSEKGDHETAQEFLDCIATAFLYYPEFFRNTQKNILRFPFMEWFTLSTSHMYLRTKDKKYADFVFEMADWAVKKAWTVDNSSKNPQYIGGLDGDPEDPVKNPPTMDTATIITAIIQAYVLAKHVRDTQRTNRYRKHIISAAAFLMRLQVQEKDISPLHSDKRKFVLGAIRGGPDDDSLRIDFAGHVMTAFLNMLKSVDGAPWSKK